MCCHPTPAISYTGIKAAPGLRMGKWKLTPMNMLQRFLIHDTDSLENSEEVSLLIFLSQDVHWG